LFLGIWEIQDATGKLGVLACFSTGSVINTMFTYWSTIDQPVDLYINGRFASHLSLWLQTQHQVIKSLHRPWKNRRRFV